MLTGVRTPRKNAIIKRRVQTGRHQLLDRTLIWNEHQLRHAHGQFELHHNAHRPHQARNQAAPLRTVPEPITDPEQITRLDIRRQDQLGGVIHEYQNAA
ncbi:integrase core domain-containing protein [Streptomyces sp. NPDC017964]|uniref:integrase core domain-containing protein n=1 Tax=Streptomyces sp. NPDC017964 TaxID=3365022 RepID=UPI0037AB3A29